MTDIRLLELDAYIRSQEQQLCKLGEVFLIHHESWKRDYGRVKDISKEVNTNQTFDGVKHN